MRQKASNYISLEFPSRSANEGFARTAVACFAAQMDPTLNELEDIKTAVSEAVTNAIVHGYDGKPGEVRVHAEADDQEVMVTVEDQAPEFDPIRFIPRDVSKDGEDRPIGGLGIILIRNVMDEVSYCREAGTNKFAMVKRRNTA